MWNISSFWKFYWSIKGQLCPRGHAQIISVHRHVCLSQINIHNVKISWNIFRDDDKVSSFSLGFSFRVFQALWRYTFGCPHSCAISRVNERKNVSNGCSTCLFLRCQCSDILLIIAKQLANNDKWITTNKVLIGRNVWEIKIVKNIINFLRT